MKGIEERIARHAVACKVCLGKDCHVSAEALRFATCDFVGGGVRAEGRAAINLCNTHPNVKT